MAELCGVRITSIDAPFGNPDKKMVNSFLGLVFVYVCRGFFADKRCPVSASPVLQTGIPRIVDCPAIADSSGEGESDVSSNESDGHSHIGVCDAIVAEGGPPSDSDDEPLLALLDVGIS